MTLDPRLSTFDHCGRLTADRTDRNPHVSLGKPSRWIGQSMEITVEIGEDDIVHFNEYLRRRRAGVHHKAGSGWLILCPLAGASAALAYVYRGQWESFILVLFAILLITFPWLSRVSLRRAVRRAMKESNRVPIVGQRRIELTNEEIRIDFAHGHTGWNWSASEAIDVDDRMLMLLISSIQGVVVPRRAFTYESEFDSFVAEARRFWEKGR
jgi:hypothetical protein